MEQKEGCVGPARGPIIEGEPEEEKSKKEGISMKVKVGQPAIDFEANAYVPGEDFKTVKLSDYKGQWIVLCFYPGDFTFV